jgi:hypothetical protein
MPRLEDYIPKTEEKLKLCTKGKQISAAPLKKEYVKLPNIHVR